MYPCMFYIRGTISLIYVDDVIFFGPEQDKIDEVIKELEDASLLFTVEEDVYAFLGFEVNTDKQSVNITLTQGGLTNKVLKKVVMLDNNKKIPPSAIFSLGTDDVGHPC